MSPNVVNTANSQNSKLKVSSPSLCFPCTFSLDLYSRIPESHNLCLSLRNMLIIIIIVLVALLYAILDVHYFLRVIKTYLVAKYLRKRLSSFLEASEVYGLCLPSDADFLLTHMNNSRYLREYDFARFDLLVRNGLMSEVMKNGGSFPVSAISVRYRQPLYMFSPYKVISAPLWWDKKFLYLDQRVVTLKDGTVRTVGFTKLAITTKTVDFEGIVEKLYPGTVKPEMSEDLGRWIESNDKSSSKMMQGQKKRID